MSLLKPSIKTPFHIDFDWWKQNESDWHVFLSSLLCPEHQEDMPVAFVLFPPIEINMKRSLNRRL
jgi:hypothetical protein